MKAVHLTELFVQQVPDVGVQPIHQREAVVFPGIILPGSERGWLDEGTLKGAKVSSPPSPGKGEAEGQLRSWALPGSSHLNAEDLGLVLVALCKLLVAEVGIQDVAGKVCGPQEFPIEA